MLDEIDFEFNDKLKIDVNDCLKHIIAVNRDTFIKVGIDFGKIEPEESNDNSNFQVSYSKLRLKNRNIVQKRNVINDSIPEINTNEHDLNK